MFEKILIANRGEIAVRINRACQELGISTVAIHSEADRDSMHVRIADESVCIGPSAVNKSYLNTHAIISACEITGAQAVHPGYGFLSENASFAKMLEDHKLNFIGPKFQHIEMMGDKIQAKKIMNDFGVPVVPGSEGKIKDVDHAIRISNEIGFPVLLKASAGGGGRGMQIVKNDEELRKVLPILKQEALSFFGNSEIYVEKFIDSPRHIEIQVMCDTHGNFLHLYERDCSVQRRNQKVIEEALAPDISEDNKNKLYKICTDAMSRMGYLGLGTLEFLYSDGNFYFMEMNTRIQVEHPVTEMVTGVDLIKQQIKVHAGQKCPDYSPDYKLRGHSIECRINAEDPEKDFRPSPGIIRNFHMPGGKGIRVDSHAYSGYHIPPHYDSMIGKLIVHAKDRGHAINRMQRALEETIIEGVKTTIPYHQKIMEDKNFSSGNFDTSFLDSFIFNSNQNEDK